MKKLKIFCKNLLARRGLYEKMSKRKILNEEQMGKEINLLVKKVKEERVRNSCSTSNSSDSNSSDSSSDSNSSDSSSTSDSNSINRRIKINSSVEENVDNFINLNNAPSQDTNDAIKYVKDENGPFIRVEPYWFDYCTWAKGRWFNTPLLEVFIKEFRDRPAAYYTHACRAGLIRVNDVVVSPGYLIRQGDRLQHRIHRHEPPVLCEPKPEIIHVGEGLLVVNKPSSIPMHPSGRYRHNTLTSHLLHSHPELFPTGHISCVNRLDRLVSGIVILSRSAEKADELRRAMQGMLFRKFYLARVQGDFNVQKINDFEYIRERSGDTSLDLIECVAPLLIVEHKLGMSCVADSIVFPAAKSAHTRFFKLSYSPSTDSSLILCEPVTGRTHQIRLHLQYLSHPIINDPLYNNLFWKDLLEACGPADIYKGTGWIEKVKEMTQKMSKSPLFQQEENDEYTENENENDQQSTAICPDCENPRDDPDPGTLSIDLHAYKYSGPMGTFSTELPIWTAATEGSLDLERLKEAEEAFNGLAD